MDWIGAAGAGRRGIVTKLRILCLFLAIAGLAARAGAQSPGSDRTRPVLSIILTRHGVRSPLVDLNQSMGRYAAEPWPDWEVGPGQMTPHGKEQMRLMGAYYRALYVDQGLLSGRASEDAGRITFRTDSDDRTIETAQDLAATLIPGQAPKIQARPRGEHDPLFQPVRAGLGHPDAALASAALLGRIGGDPRTVIAACGSAFDSLDRVLLGPGAKPKVGKLAVRDVPERLAGDPASLAVAGFTGPLRIAARCADTFVLEYADGMPLSRVGWGRVDRKTLMELMRVHSLYFNLTQASFYPAQIQGSNLARHIGQTLDQAASGRPVEGAIGPVGERMVVVVGHDTNLANLAGLLGISWWLDGTQPDPVLPGGALVFELRQGAPGGPFLVRAHYVCQSLDQMRSGEPLTPRNPPAVAPIFIPQCSGPAPGYDAPLERFDALLGRVVDPEFVVPGSS